MNAEELNMRLAAVRAGDREAFEEIYTELKVPVYTILVRMTGNEDMSEDILQEVFIRLFRSPPGQSVCNPRAYIFKMARNLAIDGMRRHRPAVSLDELENMAQEPQRDPAAKLDVETALRRLTSEQRQIVTLHINGGLRFREIAELMETPLGTVLWRYQAAVSKLRKDLSGGAI